MCSIFGVLDLKSDPVELRKKALELSRLMRHRGRIGPAFTPATKPFWLTNACRSSTSTTALNRCTTLRTPTFWRSTAKFTTTRRCANS